MTVDQIVIPISYLWAFYVESMATDVGTSCVFLTPNCHQFNALILAPGDYRFHDYWRMGLPLEIIIVIAGTPLILYFWPL